MSIKRILLEDYGYNYSSKCEYKIAYDCTAPESMDELEFIIEHMEEIEYDEFIEAVGEENLRESGLLDIYDDMPLNIEDDYAVEFGKVDAYAENLGYDVDAYVVVHSGIEHVFKKEE